MQHVLFKISVEHFWSGLCFEVKSVPFVIVYDIQFNCYFFGAFSMIYVYMLCLFFYLNNLI